MNPRNPNFRTTDEWFDFCGKQSTEINLLKSELEYYKELELRYNELLDSTATKELVQLQEINVKLTKALNRIGMLAMSEYAYTSEFTEKCKGIVQNALKNNKEIK